MYDDGDGVLTAAQTLIRGHKYDDAIHLLTALLQRRAENGSAWLLLSQLQMQVGRHTEALESASSAAARLPDLPATHYALGRAHKALGDLAAASTCYERALQLNPRDANVLTSLAVIRRSTGALDEAIGLYNRALAIDPNHASAQINLQNALTEKHLGAAGTSLEPVARTTSLSQRRSAAMALATNGRLQEARAAFESLLQLSPNDAELWLMAGTVAQALGLPPPALLPYFETAARLDPSNVLATGTARDIRFAGGIPENPTLHVQRTRWQGLFVAAIQDSLQSIEETRRRYGQTLDALLESPEKIPGELGSGAFFLAYHGESNRDLQIKVAQAHLKANPELLVSAPHCATSQRRPGRIRVGFLSCHLGQHSIGRTTGGLIKSIDRTRFETFAIRNSPALEDFMTREICAAADHEVSLDPDLDKARQQIARLELDVLFYQDIGLDAGAYKLAFARLAPVQCTSFGHPDTTGIPNIDYFVSNDLYELPEAPSDYSERLFLLRNLPTLAYYHRPTRTPGCVDRPRLGLPATATIYFCAQALFKIHPDFDPILNDILSRDPNGILVLIRGNFDHWTRSLQQRFERTLPGLNHRIVFLPTLNWSAFLELLAMADVVLDTIHFNGMNSSLESLAVGTPVVTLPTRYQRGRHTQAMYRRMEILDCIAADPGQYVELAVRLGTDRQFAASIRERIRASNAVLFENLAVVREFERFFVEATALAWPRSTRDVRILA